MNTKLINVKFYIHYHWFHDFPGGMRWLTRWSKHCPVNRGLPYATVVMLQQVHEDDHQNRQSCARKACEGGRQIGLSHDRGRNGGIQTRAPDTITI